MGANLESGGSLSRFFWIILVAASLSSAQEREALLEQAARLQREGKADSSLAAFRTALALPGNTLSQTVRCLNGLADNLVRLGRPDTALVILEQARQIGENAGDALAVELSQTYSTLAVVSAYGESGASEAIAYACRACNLREQRFGQSHLNTARTYSVLGYAYKKAGRFDSALVYLGKALEVQSRLGPAVAAECAATQALLGSVLENLGHFGDAAENFKGSLARLVRAGMDSSDQAMACHSYLATVFSSLGRISEAFDHASRSLQLSVRLYGPDAVFTSGRYAQVGELLVDLGDYDRAFEYCERAFSIMAQAPGAQLSGIANVCRMLVQIERLRGQPARALPRLRRGLEIVRSLENAAIPETALLLDEAALVHSALGDDTQALTYRRASLRTRRALSAGIPTLGIAAGHISLADLFLSRGAIDSAAVHLAESERILGSCADRNALLEGRIHALHGALASRAGDHRSAAERYQAAIGAVVPSLRGTGPAVNPTNAGIEHGEFLVEVLSSKASALRELSGRGGIRPGSADRDRAGLARAALDALECAAEIAGKMQRSFPLEGSKLSLRERTASLFRSAVETGAALSDATGDPSFAEWAFRFAERSRAGILAENIERLVVRVDTAIPDSLREKERLIVAGIRTCELTIERAGAHASAESRARLFALRQELERLQQERPAPETRQLPVPAIRTLQATLPENTLLLEYAGTEGRLRIFVVGNELFQVLAGPPCATVAEQVRSLRRAIKTLDWHGYLAVAGDLYAGLISPVRPLLRTGMRLVIVPDEELALLPFEALVPPGGTHRKGAAEFVSTPYLVRSFEISYAPSAALYYRSITSRGSPAQRSFAGFAPVFRDSKSGLIAALRSINVEGKEYGELRYSEEEVRSILTTFRRSGSEGVAFLNGSATKGEALRALLAYTHVHIATHGFANDSLPGLSGLLFAPPSGAREPEILFARETYGLRSDADLLVLSACETGLGRIARGEGVMALTHGFLSAGIHNVIYSLWRVMDRPSSDLMKSFYRHLGPGTRYEDALRRAKLEMIRTPATAFPHHWAGFVLLHGG